MWIKIEYMFLVNMMPVLIFGPQIQHGYKYTPTVRKRHSHIRETNPFNMARIFFTMSIAVLAVGIPLAKGQTQGTSLKVKTPGTQTPHSQTTDFFVRNMILLDMYLI